VEEETWFKVAIRSNPLKLQGDTVLPRRLAWESGKCWYAGVVAYSSGYSEESLASCVAVVFPAEGILFANMKCAESVVVLSAKGRHRARKTDEDP